MAAFLKSIFFWLLALNLEAHLERSRENSVQLKTETGADLNKRDFACLFVLR
jgi:hypothetical protein